MFQMRRASLSVLWIPVSLFGLFGCFENWDLGTLDTGYVDPDAGDAPPSTAFTVATYNVENFDLGGDADGQYANVAAFAAEAELDVLVLQEVQQDANGDDIMLFIQALGDAGYSMPYFESSSESDGFNALAVWSRIPIWDFEEIARQNTRTAIRFAVGYSGPDVTLIACHLKSGEDPTSAAKRTQEARVLAAYIMDHLNRIGETLILLGDMNTSARADFVPYGTLDLLTLPQSPKGQLVPVNLNELPDTPTYPSSGGILDHILLSPATLQYYISGSAAVPHPAGDGPYGPSDHYPVLVKLRR